MLKLARITIVRQRRQAQALSAAAADNAFMKTLEPDVRSTLKEAAELGGGLETNVEITPLLLDSTTDIVIRAFVELLVAIESGMTDRVITLLPGPRAKKKAAAVRLHQRAFSKGTDYLNDSMPLQYNAMTTLVEKLRNDEECKADVRELDVGYFVDHIEDHLKPYGRAVNNKDNQDLEAAGGAFHAKFERLAVLASAKHDGDEAIHKRLFGVYESELEAQRAEERDMRKRAAAKKKGE